MKGSRDAAAPVKNESGEAFNLHWFGAMFLNWTTIAILMALAVRIDTIFFYVLATFIIGTRQHAIAILAHDGAHQHASRIRWLNDGATSLFGFWPLGIGIHGYRKFHFAHHRNLGLAGDPEQSHKRRFSDKWQSGASQLRLFLTDILGFGWRELVFAMYLMRPARAIDILGPLCLVGTAIWLAVVGGYAQLIAVWYAALYTSFWAVFRLRAYTEHVGTSSTHQLAEPAWWKKLLYLPANTWLHWEHHKWPGIPSWRLEKMAHENQARDEKADSLNVYTETNPVSKEASQASGKPTMPLTGEVRQ